MDPPARFSVIIAIHDPMRPSPRATVMARQLAAPTGTPLDVLTLAERGDRRSELMGRLAHGDGDLVVLDAHGGGLAGDLLFDEDAETVLQHISTPVLVIGPHVSTLGADQLVVFGDATRSFEPSLDVVARWMATIPCDAVDVVSLEAPSAWPRTDDDDGEDDRDLDGLLSARHLAATVHRVATLEACPTICDEAVARRDPVIVVTAPRWPGTDHWFSTARCVIRHASCPVLVVPRSARVAQR
jgi:nucleotide-binding universal stress UspA family protein